MLRCSLPFCTGYVKISSLGLLHLTIAEKKQEFKDLLIDQYEGRARAPRAGLLEVCIAISAYLSSDKGRSIGLLVVKITLSAK